MKTQKINKNKHKNRKANMKQIETKIKKSKQK